MQPTNLIVCGAEKCGTTSLFAYLSAHPAVCPSSKKETDHFRDPDATLAAYEAYFSKRDETTRVLLESSPGYMAESAAVAPRIAAHLPQARLVFLLRDPVDRLRSSFRFYKSRLHLPEQTTFDGFVQQCFAFERGQRSAAELGLLEWHLRSLARGRYEDQLAAFQRCMPADQLLVVHYDELRDDVRHCVGRIARFAGLDPAFFDTFEFGRENVSFLARHRAVQQVAIQLNDQLEGVWRRHPALKKRLLKIYKRFNERQLDPDTLPEASLAELRTWYAPTDALLARVRGKTG